MRVWSWVLWGRWLANWKKRERELNVNKWQNYNNKNEFENIKIYTPRLTGSQLEINDVIFFLFFFFCIQISQAALLLAASVSRPFKVWPTCANWPTMTLCPSAKVLHQQQENHRDSNVAPDIFFCFGAEHTHTHTETDTQRQSWWFINSTYKIELNVARCCRF